MNTDRDDPTNRRIVAAAIAEFEREGLRRGAVDRIAQAAGVGRATLYRRFPDKDALVQAVLDHKLSEKRAAFRELMARHDDPRERLTEAFVAMVRVIREDRLLQRMLVVEPEVVLPLLTSKGGDLLEVARDYLADELRKVPGGLSTALDPLIVAEIAVRLMHSLLVTPGGILGADEEVSREVARRYLAPAMLPR